MLVFTESRVAHGVLYPVREPLLDPDTLSTSTSKRQAKLFKPSVGSLFCPCRLVHLVLETSSDVICRQPALFCD
jgi:hypothetical protein